MNLNVQQQLVQRTHYLPIEYNNMVNAEDITDIMARLFSHAECEFDLGILSKMAYTGCTFKSLDAASIKIIQKEKASYILKIAIAYKRYIRAGTPYKAENKVDDRVEDKVTREAFKQVKESNIMAKLVEESIQRIDSMQILKKHSFFDNPENQQYNKQETYQIVASLVENQCYVGKYRACQKTKDPIAEFKAEKMEQINELGEMQTRKILDLYTTLIREGEKPNKALLRALKTRFNDLTKPSAEHPRNSDNFNNADRCRFYLQGQLIKKNEQKALEEFRQKQQRISEILKAAHSQNRLPCEIEDVLNQVKDFVSSTNYIYLLINSIEKAMYSISSAENINELASSIENVKNLVSPLEKAIHLVSSIGEVHDTVGAIKALILSINAMEACFEIQYSAFMQQQSQMGEQNEPQIVIKPKKTNKTKKKKQVVSHARAVLAATPSPQPSVQAIKQPPSFATDFILSIQNTPNCFTVDARVAKWPKLSVEDILQIRDKRGVLTYAKENDNTIKKQKLYHSLPILGKLLGNKDRRAIYSYPTATGLEMAVILTDDTEVSTGVLSCGINPRVDDEEGLKGHLFHYHFVNKNFSSVFTSNGLKFLQEEMEEDEKENEDQQGYELNAKLDYRLSKDGVISVTDPSRPSLKLMVLPVRLDLFAEMCAKPQLSSKKLLKK